MADYFGVDSVADNRFWQNGPAPGSLYTFPGISQIQKGISTRTLAPVTTGTSVIGVVFDKGVAIAADTLGSYGSLARYRQCERLMKVNDTTVLGAGGDYADFQFLQDIIVDKIIEDECTDDGFYMKPKSLHCWLTRVLYNRRSKFNPLWNSLVVGGLQDGEPFLGYVDKIGTAFESKHIATGYGIYIALPMLRDAIEKKPDLTAVQAKDLLTECLRVLYYRDARAFHKYQIATVTEDGVSIEGPLELNTNWDVALDVCGYE